MGQMIYLDNGISVFSGRQYKCDPRRCARDAVNLVSHAHFDHVPSSFAGSVVCSEITGAIMSDRTGSSLQEGACEDVALLDSGHVPGSTMFLIDGDRRILYTGDLCTRHKYFSPGARPVKADILIIESTFGRDKYVFPPADQTIKSIRDWAGDNAAKGLHSVIFAYAFGKAQEIIACLEGFDVYATAPVIRINRILGRFGQTLDAKPLPGEPEGPVVVVAPSAGRYDPGVRKFLAAGARTASVSGWAVDPGHKYAMKVDEAFPLSDHADYRELLDFTKAVGPEAVYTFHGSDKALARDIQHKLGIEATPLKKGHLTLSHFS